ncbi:MAG TPA: zinc ribbon domain-containing protein [Solirubrobacterales bacterium]|nr:zinc ribbon domain-containing protein [Solirubrobacterales bacterium]
MNDPGKCAACGEEKVPGAAFCRACGARHEEPGCSRCQAPIVPGAAFCRECGAPIGEAQTVEDAQPAVGPPATEATAVKPTPPRPTPPPPASPPPRRRDGSRRTSLLIAAAILLVGAGAAGAIVLARGGGGESTTTVAGKEAAATPTGEEAPEEETAAVDSDGLPDVSRAEMEGEIEAMLLAFHEDVVAHDFRSAWALLTARKRQQNVEEHGYAEWAEGQETLAAYLSPGGLRVRIDGLEGDGVARVDIDGMGWSDPVSPCSEWSGLTWVRFERGSWAYDPGYSTTAARRSTWQPRKAELLGETC